MHIRSCMAHQMHQVTVIIMIVLTVMITHMVVAIIMIVLIVRIIHMVMIIHTVMIIVNSITSLVIRLRPSVEGPYRIDLLYYSY